MQIEKVCLTCSKSFLVRPCRENKVKFCSHPCYAKSLVGIGSKNKTGKYVKCKLCNKEFWVQPNEEKNGRKFCSSKCYHNSPSPNIGRKQIRKKIMIRRGTYRKCETCKKTFYAYPYQKNRRFCSMECTKTGIYSKCKNCGKEFWTKKCLENKTKFCCKKCSDKGLKTGKYKKCKTCGKEFYVTKDRLERNNGKYCSLKCSAKIGKENPNWKNGVSTENHKQRTINRYRKWQKAVLKRDNWTCQKTKVKGGYLHSHHILNFSQYPELRFEVSNGITFSKKAHYEFHKKYGWKNNTREQIEEFLKV